MIFHDCIIPGAWIIEQERIEDERGCFARTFCREEFAARGLSPDCVQASLSVTRRRGTVRGMHFQRPPHGEAKLVRCARGRIFDVVVDLRPDSPARHRWLGVELSAANGRMLYVPPGCAHGFQTLEDDVEVAYQMSHSYVPQAGGGIRYDDPAIGVEWPLDVTCVSERDQSWLLLRER